MTASLVSQAPECLEKDLLVRLSSLLRSWEAQTHAQLQAAQDALRKMCCVHGSSSALGPDVRALLGESGSAATLQAAHHTLHVRLCRATTWSLQETAGHSCKTHVLEAASAHVAHVHFCGVQRFCSRQAASPKVKDLCATVQQAELRRIA